MRHYRTDWITKLPIAHRGLWGGGVPENSLAAFGAAAAAGYAIEFDVTLSADARLVVSHDPTTGRVAGADLRVSRSRAADLAALSLGGGQAMPLLEDVMRLVAGRVPLLIEIKKGLRPAAAGQALLAALSSYDGEVAAESFDPRIVAWIRRHAPDVPRVQAASSLPENRLPRWLRAVWRGMPLNWWARPQFIAYDVRDYPKPMVRFWSRVLGAPVILWTVESQDKLRMAQDFDCNVIFENVRPDCHSA